MGITVGPDTVGMHFSLISELGPGTFYLVLFDREERGVLALDIILELKSGEGESK